MAQYPSLFNDVIGPVMVGPSSSHTAASARIGRLVRHLAGGLPQTITFGFDRGGSLAETYRTQGVGMGLLAGVLGLEPRDTRLPQAFELARQAGLDYGFRVEDYGGGHPNTYYIQGRTATGAALSLTARSTGGGMVDIIAYQGFPLVLTGGLYAALWEGAPAPVPLPPGVRATQVRDGGRTLHLLESPAPLPADLRSGLPGHAYVEPVLPVADQLEPAVPFDTAVAALAEARARGLALWQLAARYESVRAGISEAAVVARMEDLVGVLEASLAAPPQRGGDVLPRQAHLLEAVALPGGALPGAVTAYVTRFMEIKWGLGVYVAAPTGGACGCLPGAVFALAGALGLGRAEMARAMLAGGLVGVFIARHSTFAAEVAGCQAECGAGGGMAAAACAELLGGTARQGLDAASMALQSVLGLVCDPVAGRVEAPCLGKNILCAQGGLASAHMALCGFDAVIPLDETIAAMDAVGRAIPRALRCTGLGGLSVTPTAKALERRLEGTKEV